MTARVNHDERICLFACFLKSAPAAFLKSAKLLSFLIDHHFSWIQLCFPFYYWHACSNNNRLGNSSLLKLFDRLGVKNCPQCQHRTDYYRSFKMFCPRALKSWQPVKHDCYTNSFPSLNLWLTDTFLAVFTPLWFKSSYWLRLHRTYLICFESWFVLKVLRQILSSSLKQQHNYHS